MAVDFFSRLRSALGWSTEPGKAGQAATASTPGETASFVDPDRPQAPATDPAQWPEAEWRRRLDPAQFAVLRKEATERAHSSTLNREKRAGSYLCAGCGAPLFSHEGKFDSGTGWPSFHTALPGALATRSDLQLLQVRTEYHCARCGGHQGHVFDDGPAPSGQRYCNNGLALRFVPDAGR